MILLLPIDFMDDAELARYLREQEIKQNAAVRQQEADAVLPASQQNAKAAPGSTTR